MFNYLIKFCTTLNTDALLITMLVHLVPAPLVLENFLCLTACSPSSLRCGNPSGLSSLHWTLSNYTVKKVSNFPVPSRYVNNQTLPGQDFGTSNR